MGKSAQVFKIEWIAQLNQQSLRLSQCNQFIHMIQTSIDQRRFWSDEVCVLFIKIKPQRLPIKLSYSFQMGESRFLFQVTLSISWMILFKKLRLATLYKGFLFQTLFKSPFKFSDDGSCIVVIESWWWLSFMLMKLVVSDVWFCIEVLLILVK